MLCRQYFCTYISTAIFLTSNMSVWKNGTNKGTLVSSSGWQNKSHIKQNKPINCLHMSFILCQKDVSKEILTETCFKDPFYYTKNQRTREAQDLFCMALYYSIFSYRDGRAGSQSFCIVLCVFLVLFWQLHFAFISILLPELGTSNVGHWCSYWWIHYCVVIVRIHRLF